MSRVAQGDADALEVLYDRHASSVLGFILYMVGDRPLAEDVLQESFLRVWHQASSFQPERGSFTTWLFRLARNLAIDQLRRRQARPQAAELTEDGQDPLDCLPNPDPSPFDLTWVRERRELVQAALQALPREQRQVVELSYFHGLTRREIAQFLGWPEGTVHTRARRGLQQLHELLTSHGLGLEDVD